MLKLNKTLATKVRDKITIPDGFSVKIEYDNFYNTKNNKALSVSMRKNEGKSPKYVEDIFDFGVYFWDHHYGEVAKTIDEYVEVINNVLSLKARGWEYLMNKEKKEEEKAKAEAEKEAKKAEKKKKKNG